MGLLCYYWHLYDVCHCTFVLSLCVLLHEVVNFSFRWVDQHLRWQFFLLLRCQWIHINDSTKWILHPFCILLNLFSILLSTQLPRSVVTSLCKLTAWNVNVLKQCYSGPPTIVLVGTSNQATSDMDRVYNVSRNRGLAL